MGIYQTGENEYSGKRCDRTFVKWGYHFENSSCEIVGKSECCFLLQVNRKLQVEQNYDVIEHIYWSLKMRTLNHELDEVKEMGI